MKALLPQTSLDLINLFEESVQPIIGYDGQRLSGILARKLDRHYPEFSSAPLDAWLISTGCAGVVEADFEDEPVLVEVEEDDDPDWVRFRDPNTLRWQRVPVVDTEVRQIAEQPFLHAIADLLDIPKATRNGITKPMIPGVLWSLGSARFGDGLHRQVWLVRKLDPNLPEVMTQLESCSSSGLLVSTSEAHSNYICLPDGIVLCSLHEAVVPHLDETRLDIDWLYRRMLGVAETAADYNFPIEYDQYRKVLTIPGKKPWILKGEKQANAIKYMYDQARKGRWELQAKEILVAAQGKGKTGGASRMSSLFSSNVEWVDYIENPKRGIYSFNLS